MKFWDNVGDPSYVTMPLSDCLSRFVLQIFAIKSRNRQKNRTNTKVFGTQFFPEGRPNTAD